MLWIILLRRDTSSKAKDTQMYSLHDFKEVNRDCPSVTYKLLMFLIKRIVFPGNEKTLGQVYTDTVRLHQT